MEILPQGLQRVEAWTSVGRNAPAQGTASQGDSLSIAAWRLAGAKENAAGQDPSNEGHGLRRQGADTSSNIHLHCNSFHASQGFSHVLDTALQRIKGQTWHVLKEQRY